MSKDQIREKFIQARQTLSWTWIQQKSRKIMETLFGLKDFQQARAVMFYVDMRKEVLTREAIEKALKQGKRVIVPKVKKGYGLLAIEIEDLNELKPGDKGVITRILGGGLVKRKLMEMGVTSGVEVLVRKVAPLGDPIEVNIRGYELAFRRADAKKILVE